VYVFEAHFKTLGVISIIKEMFSQSRKIFFGSVTMGWTYTHSHAKKKKRVKNVGEKTWNAVTQKIQKKWVHGTTMLPRSIRCEDVNSIKMGKYQIKC
jgi:hypothetical protein